MFKDWRRNGTKFTLSVKETLGEHIFESMYKTRPRDSEQIKTTFALYNQSTKEKGEPASFSRMKNMVKKYLATLYCQK